MNSDCKVTFFHSPNSRSVGTLILLEELGADYELGTLDLQKDEQRQAWYLAINPMGKVPAIVHRGVRSSPSRAPSTPISPISIPKPASRRPSAMRCAARTCAGSSSTARRTSRR